MESDEWKGARQIFLNFPGLWPGACMSRVVKTAGGHYPQSLSTVSVYSVHLQFLSPQFSFPSPALCAFIYLFSTRRNFQSHFDGSSKIKLKASSVQLRHLDVTLNNSVCVVTDRVWGFQKIPAEGLRTLGIQYVLHFEF